MKKSRCILLKAFGGCSNLCIQDIELPPLEDKIEVDVKYGGINFADVYMRKGLIDRETPFVLGIECAGVITDIGKDVGNTSFEVGQRVICYNYNGGMYREVIRTHPNNCFLLPDFISFSVGAAIFVNYLTAHISLINIGNLKENESVLILSCAGGVGSAAVQLSKMIHGVKIFGTGSSSKQAYAEKNGLQCFFHTDTFLEQVKNYKFDVILSNESGPTFTALQNCLRPLGRIILIGANNSVRNHSENEDIKSNTKEHDKITSEDVTSNANEVEHDKVHLRSLLVNNRVVSGFHLGTLLATDRETVEYTLNYLFALYKKKKIEPIIDSIWKMSEIAKGTQLLEERKNIGKVLIDMSENIEMLK